MLSKMSEALPEGEGWLFEPKWDGFRCIVFRDGAELRLQSRDLKPLDRYFPELADPIRRNLPERCIVDGEVVIAGPKGLDFEALLLRIHPAASRVAMLAEASPASLVVWDLLALGDEDLRERPFEARRQKLEDELAEVSPPVHLTPAGAGGGASGGGLWAPGAPPRPPPRPPPATGPSRPTGSPGSRAPVSTASWRSGSSTRTSRASA